MNANMTLLEIKQYWEVLVQKAVSCVSTDKRALFVIITLALLLRLPAVGYPESTVFDEATYVSYAMHDVRGVPYFDIHPPLARMLFGLIASQHNFTIENITMDIGQSFGDFPYVPIRMIVVFAGVLLSVVLYFIMRQLLFRPEIAIIPALFVVFDNLLVSYSRLMLPDTFLLLSSMLALLCMLLVIRSAPRWIWPLTLLLGILLGASLAIKWTGLGIIFLVMVWLFWEQRAKIAFVAFGIAIFFYLIIFSSYLSRFSGEEAVAVILPPYQVEWIEHTIYPPGDSPLAILAFLPGYHETIMRSNRDAGVTALLPKTPTPLAWPIARSVHVAWGSLDGARAIVFSGNSVLWILCYFLFLFEVGWCAWNYFRTRVWPIGKIETLILLGYLVNYLPFLLISRPMYLYHYLTALLFLFLLAPYVAPRVRSCVRTLARDNYIGTVLMLCACILIVIAFFLEAPLTYGL